PCRVIVHLSADIVQRHPYNDLTCSAGSYGVVKRCSFSLLPSAPVILHDRKRPATEACAGSHGLLRLSSRLLTHWIARSVFEFGVAPPFNFLARTSISRNRQG